MKIEKTGLVLSLLAGLLLSSGCTTLQTAAKIESLKEVVSAEGKQALDQHRQINDVTYKNTELPDIVGEPFTLFKGERLPAVFQAQYSIATSRPESLSSIAQRITQL